MGKFFFLKSLVPILLENRIIFPNIKMNGSISLHICFQTNKYRLLFFPSRRNSDKEAGVGGELSQKQMVQQRITGVHYIFVSSCLLWVLWYCLQLLAFTFVSHLQRIFYMKKYTEMMQINKLLVCIKKTAHIPSLYTELCLDVKVVQEGWSSFSKSCRSWNEVFSNTSFCNSELVATWYLLYCVNNGHIKGDNILSVILVLSPIHIPLNSTELVEFAPKFLLVC